MGNDLTLADLPVEVLLDNVLPFVPVHDLLRLASISKVRSIGSVYKIFCKQIL